MTVGPPTPPPDAGAPDADAQEPAASTVRPCPSCGAPVLAGDNFCEACRARLGRACGYCADGLVGADGYCQSCGRKAPAERDHIETDLGLVAGVTDRGIRHFRNEDAMALGVAGPADAGSPAAVAVVCDGVSTSENPDEASQAAVQAALSVLLAAARDGADPQAASRDAIDAAQQAVVGLPVAAGHDSPSATYVSALITSTGVTVCWLGDSRAYWLDAAAGARQLTTDDSLATELVSAGLLSQDEALDTPQAHVVTGWLGADPSEAKPHVTTFEPLGPGVVLLCSDGLWNYAPEAADLAARALPQASAEPLAAARSLTDFALESGGHDNITVVLVPFPLQEKHDA